MGKFIQNIFTYGIGGILQKAIGLLLLPFFTSELSPQDYGVISLITLLTVGLTGFLSLGTGNSMGILYFSEKEKAKRGAIIWTNALLLLMVNSFFLGVLFSYADRVSSVLFDSNEYALYILLSVVGLSVSLIYSPFLDWLRMEQNAKKYTIVTIFNALLTLMLSAFFVLYNKMGLYGFFLSSISGNFISLCIVMFFVARKLPCNIDIRLWLPLVKLGFPSIWGVFAFLFIDYIDRKLIQDMMGLEALGIYTIGYSLGMIMLLFVGAFGNAWAPFFISYINKQEEAKRVFPQVYKYYFLSFGFIVLMAFAFGKMFVYLMVDEKFYQAFQVVGIIVMSYLLKGLYLISLPSIYFYKKMWWQAIIEWSAAITNIILNFVLIPYLGILGAALATLLSYFVLVVFCQRVSSRYLTITYWTGETLFIVGLYIIVYLFLFIASLLMPSMWNGVVGFISVLLVVFVIYKLVLNSDEKAFLLNLKEKII